MPGGVSSPVRAFGPVGGTPRFIARARGAHLEDEDGRELVDLVGSWGAAIVGHAHPAVVEAIERTARDGTSYGLCSRLEAELAEAIIDRMPWIEMIRFVNSGTEAAMSLVRLARAATGRDLVVKLDGCYHGHADPLLVEAGSGVATHAIAGTAGVTGGAVASTLTAPFNDAGAVGALMGRHPGRVAAVMIEPVAGNMGVVPPVPGYLEALRGLCDRHGALLIFDEVMTGFRVHPGGAQGLYGVRPDLTALGKVIGGGLPVGAYGGRAELMRRVAPLGDVYQAGTLSGNPLAMAAGLATLNLLDAAAYGAIEEAAGAIEAGLRGAMGGRGVVQRVGAMLSPFFGVEDGGGGDGGGGVHNFAAARAADQAVYARFFHAMLARGVHLPPSGFEAWFPGLMHTPGVVGSIIGAARGAMADIGAGP